MALPPLKVIDSASNTIDAAALKLKVPYNTAIKSGVQVELLQPTNKNRLTAPNDGRLGSVTGINVGTYAIVVLADATNDWLTSQSSGIEPSIGDRVWVGASVSVPAGLSTATDYYVVANVKESASGGVKLSTTRGGAAIDITGTGSGTVRLYPMDKPFYYTSGTRPASNNTGTPSIAVNASSPVSQSADLLFTAFTAGDFISFPFTIDTAEKGQILNVEFKYALSSSGSINAQVWAHDITNGVLVPVTPYLMQYAVSLTQEFSGVFQAPTNSTSYELIIFRAADSAALALTGTTLKINEVSVSRKPPARGAFISDWTSWSPVLTGSGGNPTMATVNTMDARYRRNGSNLEITASYAHTSATGAVNGTGNWTFPLPPGFTIDTARIDANIATGTAKGVVGAGGSVLTGSGGSLSVQVYDSTHLGFYFSNTANNYSQLTYAGLSYASSTVELSFTASVPIMGWGTSQVLSSDEDGRVCSASMYGAANLTALAPNNTYVKVPFDTATFDTHGKFDTTNKRYVAPLAGYYEVSANVILASTNVLANQYRVALFKNGVLYGTMATATPAVTTVFALSGSIMISLIAGDYVEVFLFGAGNNSASTLTVTGGSTFSNWNVTRQTGPAQILASEAVSASYYLSANFTSSATIPINFDTKVIDTHNAVTTSATAWKFAAPVSGTYEISCFAVMGGTVSLFKNGVIFEAFVFNNGTYIFCSPILVSLTAGDFIDLRTNASLSVSGGAISNGISAKVTIKKVGN